MISSGIHVVLRYIPFLFTKRLDGLVSGGKFNIHSLVYSSGSVFSWASLLGTSDFAMI